MNQNPHLYTLAEATANRIETELKRLNRWTNQPLPPEKFENMGAFGSNTMAFEQWIQFILIPRIRDIVKENGDFPDSSMLSTYAVRIFDGDPDASDLHQLLSELDDLINQGYIQEYDYVSGQVVTETVLSSVPAETVGVGDATIPPVIFTLAELLPQFEGDDLESQLQTFDTFLSIVSPSVRPEISALLSKAAAVTSNEDGRKRIEQAAMSVAAGGRAAEPYNHEEAMKKYQEEHRKSFDRGQ